MYTEAVQTLASLARPGSGSDVDLILLDLGLRDFVYSRSLQHLLDEAPDLPPLLALSTGCEPYVDSLHVPMHAAGLIYKPFDIDDLLRAVKDALTAPRR